MYIERVPKRNSPPAVLLRESYREGKKVKKRTLANLSKLPSEVIENLRLSLKGAQVKNYSTYCTTTKSLRFTWCFSNLYPVNFYFKILYPCHSIGLAILSIRKFRNKRMKNTLRTSGVC
jgi:hypothetical protein